MFHTRKHANAYYTYLNTEYTYICIDKQQMYTHVYILMASGRCAYIAGYMCIYKHIYIYIYIYIYTCTYIYTYVYTRIHAYMHTVDDRPGGSVQVLQDIHAYIYIYIYIYMFTYICMYKNTCMQADRVRQA